MGTIRAVAAASGCGRFRRWFGGEVLRIYRMLSGSEEEEERRRFVELIEREGRVVTPRDAQQTSRLFRTGSDVPRRSRSSCRFPPQDPPERTVRLLNGHLFEGRPEVPMRQSGLSAIAILAACALVLVAGRPAFPRYFIRGDADRTRRVDIRDAVRILHFLFGGTPDPERSIPCLDLADADDDGRVSINDPVFLLDHLFRGGPGPPAPYPDWGADPTPDLLECVPTTTFWGMEIDSDANFFLIERSGSMENRGELDRAKIGLSRVLPWLPEGGEFAVVFFDEGAISFPEAAGPPAVAGDASLPAALRFVDQVPGGRGTCPIRGLGAVLEFANLSSAEQKTVWIVSGAIGVRRLDLGREAVSLEEVLDELSVENPRC